ncbi:MAG: L,D-transpeptidase [Streptosporangiaceae bacterium]
MKILPRATTFATLRGAPADPMPFSFSDGHIVHPVEEQIVFASPDGAPLAVLPTTELKSPTWVPVIDTIPGWHRILLPSKPNRSTGWIRATPGGLQHARSTYRIHIELGIRRLSLLNHNSPARAWSVAVGATSTPTPTGRTYLLASLLPEHPTYSPRILPLGIHSASMDTYGGGPATVALHGWPDDTVFGRGASHGCVRVPAKALRALAGIPLGTPVLISP